MKVDIERLSAELETLAEFSDAPPPAVTRVVYSETDRRARQFVKGLCVESGLAVREDAVGNTFARWPGTEPQLAAVGTGSHIDAIPHAGRYDGTVGVLGGLEAIRALQRGRGLLRGFRGAAHRTGPESGARRNSARCGDGDCRARQLADLD